MKTLTKLFLALGMAFALSSCGGGGGDDIFTDDGYTDNDYNDNYNNGGDYTNGGDYDNGGDYTNSGDSVSLYSLGGHSVYGTDGSSIQFCSDGSIYYYANHNGNYTGTYSAVNGGTKLDFYDSDGGSYAIQTYDGTLEVGYTYNIVGASHSITIDSIGYSGC